MWELNQSHPTIRYWPKLLEFLGGYPFATETVAEQLLAYRRYHGISAFVLARQLDVDPGTIARWEEGLPEQEPYRSRVAAKQEVFCRLWAEFQQTINDKKASVTE